MKDGNNSIEGGDLLSADQRPRLSGTEWVADGVLSGLSRIRSWLHSK